MFKFCEELANEIISSEKFNAEYKNLCLNLALKQVEHLNITDKENINFPDLVYLLRCANIFLQNNNDILNEKVLRIAQFAIQFWNNVEKEISYILLDSLFNSPAISLAKNKNLLDKNIEYYLPLKLSLQKLNRENENSFESNNETIICNPFQKKIIKLTNNFNTNMLSISAPTSSGKSFIVLLWLIKNLELENDSRVNIAIIVPTRALINQYHRDLVEKLQDNLKNVHIETMPFRNGNILDKKKVIYIFTQERMNAFLLKNSNLNFKILFVDEAQKIGDDYRGVLLEAVIEKIKNISSKTRVILASPFTNNPQEVYPETEVLKSYLATVNQNFYKISRIKGKPLEWDVLALYDNTFFKIAKIILPERINGGSIPAILTTFVNIVTQGRKEDNNLIYANYPADAEKIAEILYEKTDYNVQDNEEIIKLIDLCKNTVHKEFNLIKFLKKGIAFHYGSMPQLIRANIEKLFNKKIIKNLICTSTLLEGVNLSCKNIFIKNPKRSKNLNMSTPDLFNLVGRAGRLGKEFYGNIFYVDWEDAPVKKEEIKVERSIQRVLNINFDKIIEALTSDFINVTFENDNDKDTTEATIGYLYTQFLKLGDIGKNKEVSIAFSQQKILQLNNALKEYSNKIQIPRKILEKYPVTYHYSMQKLFEYFNSRHPDEPEAYRVDLKNEDKISLTLSKALCRIKKYFNVNIKNENFIWYLSYLVKHWIKFQNLSVIIDLRRQHFKEEKFNASVRKVFKDIDDYVRYLIPKLLFCYIDVLNFYYEQSGNYDLIYEDLDIDTIFEYGIENKTQLSMITLGLSRSTILKLFEIKYDDEHYLVDNVDMDELKALNWLFENIKYIKDNKKLPKLLIEEIEETLRLYDTDGVTK